MKMPGKIAAELLAPCGLNCLLCYKHLSAKNPCPGCRQEGAGKPAHCQRCSRKECAQSKGLAHCFQCEQFPCKLIKNLERTYSKRYGVSLIENGRMARARGLEQFMQQERGRWSCSECEGIVCMHDGQCSDCRHLLERTVRSSPATR